MASQLTRWEPSPAFNANAWLLGDKTTFRIIRLGSAPCSRGRVVVSHPRTPSGRVPLPRAPAPAVQVLEEGFSRHPGRDGADPERRKERESPTFCPTECGWNSNGVTWSAESMARKSTDGDSSRQLGVIFDAIAVKDEGVLREATELFARPPAAVGHLGDRALSTILQTLREHSRPGMEPKLESAFQALVKLVSACFVCRLRAGRALRRRIGAAWLRPSCASPRRSGTRGCKGSWSVRRSPPGGRALRADGCRRCRRPERLRLRRGLPGCTP